MRAPAFAAVPSLRVTRPRASPLSSLRCKLPSAAGTLECDDISSSASFAPEQRHGAALPIPRVTMRELLETRRFTPVDAAALAASAPKQFYCMANDCSSANSGTTPGVVAP